MVKYIKAENTLVREQICLMNILSGIDNINDNYEALVNSGNIDPDVNEAYNRVSSLLNDLNKTVRSQLQQTNI